MATAKTTTLTFRIEPRLKETLRMTAERQHRSIANMLEALIRDYCGRNGITIPDQQALFLDDDRTAQGKTNKNTPCPEKRRGPIPRSVTHGTRGAPSFCPRNPPRPRRHRRQRPS